MLGGRENGKWIYRKNKNVNRNKKKRVNKVYGQKNFWKLYLSDFLPVLGIVENKQVDILIYILENTQPSNNMFIGTYKTIRENTKASETTIAKVMKKLQEQKFLKKIQNGLWQVSPNIMMKGNENKKQLLLSYFCNNNAE